MNVHQAWCLLSCLAVADTSYVMDDSTIRTAVNAWLSDATAAAATYGHISTWETGGWTDMAICFGLIKLVRLQFLLQPRAAALSFNDDIGAWDTSAVTRIHYMDRGRPGRRAGLLNQDIPVLGGPQRHEAGRSTTRSVAFDQNLGSAAVGDDVQLNYA